MYIQKVKLQNFRSFGDEGICFLFNKGINAVIGENNNGKTALIDSKLLYAPFTLQHIRSAFSHKNL